MPNAYRQIAGAKVIDAVTSIGVGVTPQNIEQTRPLAKLLNSDDVRTFLSPDLGIPPSKRSYR